jgi:large subunit ribosomal protein L18
MAKQSRNERRKRRHRRVRQNVVGMPGKPRLNVFRSLSHIYAQVIDDLKGETVVAASSLDDDVKAKSGDLTKVEQARLVGELVAERAAKAGIDEVVFDRGGYKYHGRVRALAEGAREGGLKF